MLNIFKIILKVYEVNHISEKILRKHTQLDLTYNFNWKSENVWEDQQLESNYLNSSSNCSTSLEFFNKIPSNNNILNNFNSIFRLTSYNLNHRYDDFSDPFSFFLKSDRLSNIVPNKKDSFLLHYITLHNFIENMSKSKIIIINRSSLNKHPDYLNVINNTYLLVKKIYKRSVRRFNLYNFIYILVSSLVLNDIILFKNFVLRKMSGVRFKKHKRLLSMFRYAFRLATSFFLHRRLIKGFFFAVSGKIGIGGSVKRKVWKYSTGSVNLSCKRSKVKYQLFQIWTRTGCLGCKVGLSV